MHAAAAGERGTQSLPQIIPLVRLAAERASNDSIALLNDLAATVRSTAQSGLQTLANAPAQFVEAFGRAQALVSNQFVATPLEADIQHPFPAYPDTLFTWSVCNTSNPYLVVSVRDQEVSLHPSYLHGTLTVTMTLPCISKHSQESVSCQRGVGRGVTSRPFGKLPESGMPICSSAWHVMVLHCVVQQNLTGRELHAK